MIRNSPSTEDEDNKFIEALQSILSDMITFDCCPNDKASDKVSDRPKKKIEIKYLGDKSMIIESFCKCFY